MQRLAKVEAERDALHAKFEKAIFDVQRKSGLKNMVLERKLEAARAVFLDRDGWLKPHERMTVLRRLAEPRSAEYRRFAKVAAALPVAPPSYVPNATEPPLINCTSFAHKHGGSAASLYTFALGAAAGRPARCRALRCRARLR